MLFLYLSFGASQVALVVKNPPANAGDARDTDSIPGSGRSPGVRNGTHSSILAWRITWTVYSGGPKELDMTERLSLLVFISFFLVTMVRLTNSFFSCYNG